MQTGVYFQMHTFKSFPMFAVPHPCLHLRLASHRAVPPPSPYTPMFTVSLAVSVSSAVTRTAKCDVKVNPATPDIDDQVTGTVTFTQEV